MLRQKNKNTHTHMSRSTVCMRRHPCIPVPSRKRQQAVKWELMQGISNTDKCIALSNVPMVLRQLNPWVWNVFREKHNPISDKGGNPASNRHQETGWQTDIYSKQMDWWRKRERRRAAAVQTINQLHKLDSPRSCSGDYLHPLLPCVSKFSRLLSPRLLFL